MYTTCELCDRTMPTKDWNGHKNSKKHREAEAKDKVANEPEDNAFGGDSAGFTTDTGAAGGDPHGNGTFTTTTTAGNDAWGTGDGFNNNAGFTNNTGGGGGNDRGCFTCGEQDHQKRECPSNAGGAGRNCFSCGEPGHQKRDCPSGGSGGEQTCYNCGLAGYINLLVYADQAPNI